MCLELGLSVGSVPIETVTVDWGAMACCHSRLSDREHSSMSVLPGHLLPPSPTANPTCTCAGRYGDDDRRRGDGDDMGGSRADAADSWGMERKFVPGGASSDRGRGERPPRTDFRGGGSTRSTCFVRN